MAEDGRILSSKDVVRRIANNIQRCTAVQDKKLDGLHLGRTTVRTFYRAA